MKARTSLVTSIVAVGLITASPTIFANTVSGNLSGQDGDGEPIHGSYLITTGAGTVDVTLTNLQQNPASLGAMLSDVSFTLSSGNNVSSTLVAGSGSTVTCTDGSGGCTAGGTAKEWAYSGTGGNYTLTALGAQPPGATMIIGPTTSTYCNPTCPDGTANANFNVYFQNSAEFLLNIAGVTGTTSISNVALSFGTATGETTLVPIPAALWLFGSGLLGLIGIARRRIGVSTSMAAV